MPGHTLPRKKCSSAIASLYGRERLRQYWMIAGPAGQLHGTSDTREHLKSAMTMQFFMMPISRLPLLKVRSSAE